MFALAFAVISILGIQQDVAHSYQFFTNHNPFQIYDSPQESRLVVQRLSRHPDECILIPTLSIDAPLKIEIPPNEQRMSIMVIRKDFADLLDTRIPLGETARIIDTLKRIAAICPEKNSIYIGLDCSIRGMATGCQRLRRKLNLISKTTIKAAQYTAPALYGKRTDPKVIGFYSLGHPEGQPIF